jgi:malate dehydrogenase (oxaloacetate-decarboxylating)(NADP+)
VDAFDIEVNQNDSQKLVDIIVALEPTFGGINLEDIKAPECFFVEKECQKRMNIPVFHDDQHGSAIIAGAGLINALELVGKRPEDVRVVVCGCGAAGFTCAIHFVVLRVKPENIICVDLHGAVYKGREDLVEGNYLTRLVVDTYTLAHAAGSHRRCRRVRGPQRGRAFKCSCLWPGTPSSSP